MLRGLKKISLQILLGVIVIAALNFIGLKLYSLMTGREVLSRLWIVLVVEGIIIMVLGVLGATPALPPPSGTVGGYPWQVPVNDAIEEIQKNPSRQVNFWIGLAIIGFILFISGLLLGTMSSHLLG